jgi:acetyl esterase/lipase
LITAAHAAESASRKAVIELPGATAHVFKNIEGSQLRLHVFSPADHKPSDARPAILFFFGGGWDHGDPSQFVRHANYFASRGMVAILPDYRTRKSHGTTPLECVADGKSAVRWHSRRGQSGTTAKLTAKSRRSIVGRGSRRSITR